jgi:hypothetical protein
MSLPLFIMEGIIMNVAVDILSFVIGVVVGWLLKVAASGISMPSIGVEHTDDSPISAVVSNFAEKNKLIFSELDEMGGFVNNYKKANDDGGLTKNEVDELCSLFYSFDKKLRDV